MMFDGINLVAVAAAAIASFLFGSIWYGVLGKAWMRAASLSEDQTKPSLLTLALAFVCQCVMAFIFAGIIYHTGDTTPRTGLISAFMVWTGIVMTTQIVNHRFQGQPWSLTLIDGVHWLGVLVLQGCVIGWLS